jgi:hypothetical protein
MWQLMRTARTVETEWRQVLWGSVTTGAKEDEALTGHHWGAGFHYVMAHSCLVHILKLMNCLFILFSNFFQAAANRG